jgi:hypothetical protein
MQLFSRNWAKFDTPELQFWRADKDRKRRLFTIEIAVVTIN